MTFPSSCAWEPQSKHALTLEAQYRMNLKKIAFWGSYELTVLFHYQWSPYKSTVIWKGIATDGVVSEEAKKWARHWCGWLFSARWLARNHNKEAALHSLFKQWHVEKTTWRSADMLTLHKSQKQDLFWRTDHGSLLGSYVKWVASQKPLLLFPSWIAASHCCSYPSSLSGMVPDMVWGSPEGVHAALT